MSPTENSDVYDYATPEQIAEPLSDLLREARTFIALRPRGGAVPWFIHGGIAHGEDRPDCMACDFIRRLDARLAAIPATPDVGLRLDGGLTVEQRITNARMEGQVEAEQRATELLAAVVMAAGGEVIVPDKLIVAGARFVYEEMPLNDARRYRAALSGGTDGG